MNKRKLKTAIFERALLIRLVEQKLLELFSEGKLNGTVHTCIGQELIGVCLAESLSDDDFILSNHRGHGHLLSRENDLSAFFAELMGKKGGFCGGRGGSQHLYRHNFLSNGIQGGMTPIAVGLAMANKIRRTGKVISCFIGDGTLGEGLIYEAFNIASIWSLPVVFILENNRIAQSTSIEQTFAGSVEYRARGFGLKYLKTNIWDVDGMQDTFAAAVSSAKKEKPAFVEVDTYRINSHSKGDDNRDQAVVDSYKEKDILRQFLVENPDAKILCDRLLEQVEEAVTKAEASATLVVATEVNDNFKQVCYTALEERDPERINALINKALESEFASNIDAVMIGEDIEYLTPFTASPYGGAFKVSNDLSEKFENIKNTPISEASIVGIGTGLALEGMRPIVEIMFGDFMTLVFDQIFNHACKFPQMYNRQVEVPLVVRTPMGGKRGYGPTHSQSIEKIFLGVPDLKVVALNQRLSPEIVYKAVFKEKYPVLIIENKVLYTSRLNTTYPVGFVVEMSDEVFPMIKISPVEKKADMTVICYGGTLAEVEEAIETAFFEDEILCEVICPSLISPLNLSPILESVLGSNRLFIVEEGSNFAAYSSEVISQLCEAGINLKSVARLSNNEVIPSSNEAERNCLPDADKIYKKMIKSYNGK